MKNLRYLSIGAIAGAVLAGCSTAPQPNRAHLLGSNAPASLPYTWSVGNAPQAHREMVATFGKVGLKPGQYLWASSIPSDGETRIVIDRLTQMAYVYKADKLIGVATVSMPCLARP